MVVHGTSQFGILFQDGADLFEGGSVGGDVLNDFGIVEEEYRFDDGGELRGVQMRVFVIIVDVVFIVSSSADVHRQ